MSQLMGGLESSLIGGLGGVLTAVFLCCFVGWTWWAYAPRNRARHEAAAQMPLEGGES